MTGQPLTMETAAGADAGTGAATHPADGRRPVVVVTGMSGGGLSTALKALEDLGYEAVDNLRLSLLTALVFQAHDRPLAIGIDSRTRDFSADALLQELDALRAHPDLRVRLLFMEATEEVLQRRYTETRRPHPLAVDRPVPDGIALERTLLVPLREAAEVVIDTSQLSIHDVRRLLTGHFRLDGDPSLHVFVTSFAYRHGVPREADLVFDVRFLDNPHWDPALRPLTGLDRPVAEHVGRDPDFPDFFRHLTTLLAPLLPRYAREGKHYLTIAIGCTGGRHRSVFTAHRLAGWLRDQGYKVGEGHRDLDRRHPAPEPAPPWREVASRETPEEHR
ncbi:RNase adapter RapZ [Rhodospirillum centenum]|uniref:Nucleotide-binding protein RC1_2868 n=1 Tax=Rhodospirillum centenum (strain ATCC 51521 / SW) TaxID=414684 RepID=Y2868_RHOCS|nr:RNase adapter RapZ [Rhodospirillum centenum]B6IVB4.1 RecName: Full=Nucleotide-binding protein RC1_2868 [Rhodospirillum centenum SW]ACJ00238.1 P-loop ATPase family protein [Rhodospirillum centenum SW]